MELEKKLEIGISSLNKLLLEHKVVTTIPFFESLLFFQICLQSVLQDE